ncbi:hypothetical protein [Ramlibacter alkalitolerans]|uniref:Uncharacterized protein n=1 Tax=Ramlibacter alkalitolerans TaxID=2039631 RepID=A0ABS1JMZ7_9BURK|nr:hypothetical protein [Ramlibacter alkalitolerans]MBL0425633.1 hypothetical protein [Ramlibacter alkalitolerans]
MWTRTAAAERNASDALRIHDPVDDAYDAWKAADAAARATERAVGEAWLRHDRGEGTPPARDQLRELAYLRQIAIEKLKHAIVLLHDAGHIQPAGLTAGRTRAARPRPAAPAGGHPPAEHPGASVLQGPACGAS